MSVKKIEIYVCDYCGEEFSNKNDLFTCFNTKDICEECVNKICSYEEEKTLGDIAEENNLLKEYPEYRYLAQDNDEILVLFKDLPCFCRGEWEGDETSHILSFYYFKLVYNNDKYVYDMKEKKIIVI